MSYSCKTLPTFIMISSIAYSALEVITPNHNDEACTTTEPEGCSFNCLDTKCQGDTLTCDPTHWCEFHCADTACALSTLICPTDGVNGCEVNCNGAASCDRASILWSPTYQNNLTCLNEWACYHVTFPIPDPNVPLDIYCSAGGFVCALATINCPTDAQCRVYCHSDSACLDAIINWPTNPSVNTLLSCVGTDACLRTTTNNPSVSPTKMPSTSPTKIPSVSPTTNIPSVSPTKVPSISPTKFPSVSPTNMPSISPTKLPSISPTEIPTISPTKMPSASPTKMPSISPTNMPSVSPITSSPTTATPTTYEPTQRPSKAPTKDGEAYESRSTVATHVQTTEEWNNETAHVNTHLNIYTMLCVIITGFILLIAIIGYIDSKWLRQNDFFRISALFITIFQIFDLLSDIFLAVTIREQNMQKSTFLLLFICSVIFIILPITASFCQLLHQIYKRWWFKDKIKLWLTNNTKPLYLLSIFTGSSFTAVQLMNSNLFQLSAFSMDLTNEQLLRFQSRRVYSIILFENLPQVILQSIYLTKIAEFDLIAVSAMIFSIISIIVTIVATISERQILNSQGYASIEFSVLGSAVVANLQQCRNQTTQIRHQLSAMLGLHKSVIEIMRPISVPNGLQIQAHIHLTHILSRNIDYQRLLNESQQNGALAQMLQNVWDLKGVPTVSKIKFRVQESQNRIKNAVTMSVQSVYANQQNLSDNELLKFEGKNSGNIQAIELAKAPKILHAAFEGKTKGEIEESQDSNSNSIRGVTSIGSDIGYNTKGNDDEIMAAINKTAEFEEEDEVLEH